MKRINYKSDFDFILHLYSCLVGNDGKEVEGSRKELGWPDYDFKALFYTSVKSNGYTASCVGGVATNCYNDNGKIHVVVDGHHIGPGQLRVDFSAELPREIYPDGQQRKVFTQPLGIELVTGCGECPSAAEAEVLLPYIKGDKGDKLTYADLTAEDKADLVAPIQAQMDAKADRTEVATQLAAEAAKTDGKLAQYTKTDALTQQLASKQAALTVSDDLKLTPAGALSVEERAKRAVFDDMWTLAGGAVITPGQVYSLNGTKDITYQEAMKIMNCRIRQVESDTSLKTAFDASLVGVLKAIFPFKMKYRGGTTQFLCQGQNLIRKFVWPTNSTTNDAQFMFDGCAALKEIQGTIIFESNCNVGYTFRGCAALEEVSINLRCSGISFAYCPKLSLNSVSKIASDNGRTLTITVHADVFAKLTGDTTNAAAAALTEEELAQWGAVLDAALAKNITFATI